MEGRVTFWVLAAAIFLAFAFFEWLRVIRPSPPMPWMVSFISVMGLVFCIVMGRREVKRVVRLELGMEGERTVGQMLEKYRAFGYRVIHDIPEDDYNIDHVLIGPAGIFAIETKTISKPVGRDAQVVYDGEHVLVDGHTPDRDPIRQVTGCADRVHQIIESATGERVFVRPVVLYPGWFVVRQCQHEEVWVLEAKALRGWIDREETRLSDEQVSSFAAILTTHVRSRSEASR